MDTAYQTAAIGLAALTFDPARLSQAPGARLGLAVIFGLRRVSLELWKFMNVLHPAEPFGGLYLHRRR